MTEQQQQSKGIGELFIEFGAKGLPSLIKGLNTVSASFLLTKNAAEQLTKPIKEVFKSAGNEAVGIGKMSALLGASVKDVQRLTSYFKSKNMDTSLISDITQMQATIYDLQHGRGGLSKEMQRGFSMLGLDIFNYNESIESTLQLFQDLQTATQKLSAIDRQAYLRDFGISSEFGYLFERGEFNKSDIMTLSDDEVEKLIKSEEAAKELDETLDRIKNKGVTPVASFKTKVTKDAADILNNKKAPEDAPYATGEAASKLTNEIPFMGWLSPFTRLHAWGAANVAKQQKSIGATNNHIVPTEFGATQLDFSSIKEIFKIPPPQGQLTGGAASIVPPIMQNGHNPPNLSTSNNSVTYNNTINITGSNAQEIGQEVRKQLDLQALEYNQFQANNPPRK